MNEVYANEYCFSCGLCQSGGFSNEVTPTSGWSVNLSIRSVTEPIYIACGISLIILVIISLVCLKTVTKMCRSGSTKIRSFAHEHHALRSRSHHQCMRSNNRLCSFVTHHKFCSSNVCKSDSPLITTRHRHHSALPVSSVSLSDFTSPDESEV